MPCIDTPPRSLAAALIRLLAGPVLLALASCQSPMPPDTAQRPLPPPAQAAAPRPAPPASPAPPQAREPLPVVADWASYRLRAARLLVEANPQGSYLSRVEEPLLAIPVIEVELHADGSIRELHVARTPSQAADTVELAKAALRRAAPFGDVGRLPRPWKFNVVFLFNDARRFKPADLDR